MVKVGTDLQGGSPTVTDPTLSPAQSATSSHLYLGKLKALEAAASSREFQPPLPKNE